MEKANVYDTNNNNNESPDYIDNIEDGAEEQAQQQEASPASWVQKTLLIALLILQLIIAFFFFICHFYTGILFFTGHLWVIFLLGSIVIGLGLVSFGVTGVYRRRLSRCYKITGTVPTGILLVVALGLTIRVLPLSLSPVNYVFGDPVYYADSIFATDAESLRGLVYVIQGDASQNVTYTATNCTSLLDQYVDVEPEYRYLLCAERFTSNCVGATASDFLDYLRDNVADATKYYTATTIDDDLGTSLFLDWEELQEFAATYDISEAIFADVDNFDTINSTNTCTFV